MNANRAGKFLTLITLTTAAASATPSLGAASGFNVFALGNLTQLGGDSEGRVAVAGAASLTSTYMNVHNVAGSYGLIVGGSLQATNGSLNGNLSYDGAASLSRFTLNNGTATQQASPIDFLSARIDLEARSAYWASSVTSAWLGQVTYFNWGGVSLVGSNSALNVFNMDGSKVKSTFTISAPAGSTVLVNVSGTTNDWKNFAMQPSGVDKTRMLFNFYESTSVSITSLSFQGTLFAPKADISLKYGNIEGNLIARNVTAAWWGGEYHNQLFAGILPTAPNRQNDPAPTPEPGTMLALGAGLVGIVVLAKTKRAVKP